MVLTARCVWLGAREPLTSFLQVRGDGWVGVPDDAEVIVSASSNFTIPLLTLKGRMPRSTCKTPQFGRVLVVRLPTGRVAH